MAAAPHSLQDWHSAANRACDAGQHAQARECFARAFALAEAEWSAEAPAWVPLLNNRAVLAKYAAEFELAETLYRRALAIAESHAGFGPTELSMLYHNLGGLAHARGDFAVGEPLARRAVELSRAAFGPDHPQRLADEVAWAGLLDGLGRHAESEPIYRRALAAWEARGEMLEVAVCCHNLGALCAAQRRWPEADALYRRAVSIKQSRLGAAHPDLGLTLYNLGVLCKQRQQLAEAREHLQQALQIFDAGLDPQHPHLRACRRQLAVLSAVAADETPPHESAARPQRVNFVDADGSPCRTRFGSVI